MIPLKQLIEFAGNCDLSELMRQFRGRELEALQHENAKLKEWVDMKNPVAKEPVIMLSHEDETLLTQCRRFNGSIFKAKDCLRTGQIDTNIGTKLSRLVKAGRLIRMGQQKSACYKNVLLFLTGMILLSGCSRNWIEEGSVAPMPYGVIAGDPPKAKLFPKATLAKPVTLAWTIDSTASNWLAHPSTGIKQTPSYHVHFGNTPLTMTNDVAVGITNSWTDPSLMPVRFYRLEFRIHS